MAAGPTVASAGLSLQVPMAVVADGMFRSPAWLGKPVPAALTLGGAALILGGFFSINLGSSGSSSIEAREVGRVQLAALSDVAALHFLTTCILHTKCSACSKVADKSPMRTWACLADML
jgi:hypothetical protein